LRQRAFRRRDGGLRPADRKAYDVVGAVEVIVQGRAAETELTLPGARRSRGEPAPLFSSIFKMPSGSEVRG
jgi:hypothetical protein